MLLQRTEHSLQSELIITENIITTLNLFSKTLELCGKLLSLFDKTFSFS